MALQRQTEFAYHNIELYKSESLGSGSYGGVCKAKCDRLLCAAKIMHPTLFDLRDPGTESYLRNFREECHLLSLARHPNVVQYLGTCYDPNTRLPVLLMELCNESLTAFLERSPGPLFYHSQVNICHNITLALVYLHSNGLIHRDLTGNNVLMLAGTRAKITDFGMSKLITVNPRMRALTMCPGNILYMSPEALDEAKTYTAKLDIFSLGVIVIQILTRQFPNPTDRFHTIPVNTKQDEEDDESDDEDEEVRRVVPETKRREAHLKLIPDNHPLKSLSLLCLKKKETQRPSALQLSERLSELKQSSQYTESSIHQTQSDTEIQQLQQQVRGQRILTEARTREVQEHQTRNTELQNIVEDKDRQLQANARLLQENQAVIQAKDRQLQAIDGQLQENQAVIQVKDRQLQANDRQLQEKDGQLQESQAVIQAKERLLHECQHTIASRDHAVEMKERELQQTEGQLRASEQLVSEFQQRLQQKDKTITDLQQTILAYERKIQQLEQQDTDLPQQKSVATSQKMMTAVQKDISKMKWREGKNAPEQMRRGAAVVHENTAYFRSGVSNKVYSYQNILGKEQWSQLPDNPNKNCGLAVIDGFLTSVGGYNNDCTNILPSLTGEGMRKLWSEIFPPMPTPRQSVACVTTEQFLVVVGGWGRDGDLDIVEVMNINTKQWTTVSPLPQKQRELSATVCGDTLFLAGGWIESSLSSPSKSVFTCFFSDLLTSSNSFGSKIKCHNIWKEISCLPVIDSTLASINGQLLAISGGSNSLNYTTNVYRYDSHTNSWEVISQMKRERSSCLAVTLHEDHLIVVGGYTRGLLKTDSVEILEVNKV